MRDEPEAFRAWIRRDLRQRYGAVLREPVPADLASLLERFPPGD